MRKLLRKLMEATPRIPDFIEPDLCRRCKALKKDCKGNKPSHRPCFAVRCYCECSRVPYYIA